jgi:hypothetical protein
MIKVYRLALTMLTQQECNKGRRVGKTVTLLRGKVMLLGCPWSLWPLSGGEGLGQGLHLVTTPLYITLACRVSFPFGFFDRGGGSYNFCKALYVSGSSPVQVICVSH